MNKTFNSPDRDIANGVRSCHAVVASGVTTPLWFSKSKTCPLRHALNGLFEESGRPSPSTGDLHHWVELINSRDSRGRRDELGVRAGPLWAGNRHRISKRQDHCSRRKTWHSPKLGPQRTENSSIAF
ncbi:MAG: hypothetical protein L7W40_12765 [Akkermansiaceae bacterium]|nr:hypothetical protein [Akkermansiaceae bacterium]